MKHVILMSAAAAAMMLSASAALALDPSYVEKGDSGMMVYSGGKSTMVMKGADGKAPADCPAGSYYEGPKETIVACGEKGRTYGMMAPKEGAMMSDGKPYPKGAMMLEYRENQ